MKNILKNFAGQFIDNYAKGDNKHAFSEAEANDRHAKNLNLHYILGPDHILIDADNADTVAHMERLNASLGITPYSYKTNDEGTHKHYWFKRTEFSNKIMVDKTHVKHHELQIFTNGALTPTGTMAADIKYMSTTTSTAVFLVNSTKTKAERPNATDLNAGLANTCEIPRVFCLNPTMIKLPPNGNVNNSLMGVATACARAGLKEIDFVEMMREWNMLINRQFDAAECVRVWENKPEVNVWKQVFETFGFVFYKGNIWARIENVWTNIDEVWGNASVRQSHAMNTHIKRVLNKLNIPHENGKIEATGETVNWNSFIGAAVTHKIKYNAFQGIAFKNGYVEKGGKVFIYTDNVPFTTTQIEANYYEPTVPNELMTKFINEITFNDNNKKYGLLSLLAYSLSNINSGVMLYIRGEKQTGKSTLLELIQKIIGDNDNAGRVESDVAFGNGENLFAFRDIIDKSFVYMEEFKASLGKSAANTLKGYLTEVSTVGVQSKHGNKATTENTQSWVAVSNHWTLIPSADEAIKSRLVPYEFPATVNLTSNEWATLNHKEKRTEAINYLRWMLVQYFILDSATENSTRADKWNTLIGDHDKFWDNYDEQDESYTWINDPANTLHIDGKLLKDIYSAFQLTNLGTRITKLMFKNALNKHGWISVRKSVNGVQNHYYERKTNG